MFAWNEASAYAIEGDLYCLDCVEGGSVKKVAGSSSEWSVSELSDYRAEVTANYRAEFGPDYPEHRVECGHCHGVIIDA